MGIYTVRLQDKSKVTDHYVELIDISNTKTSMAASHWNESEFDSQTPVRT
jgi:hypothetical protein